MNPFDLLDKHIQGQGAGNISGFRTAHTIANHAQKGIAVELYNLECVLILRPDAAGIRQTPTLHRKRLLPN